MKHSCRMTFASLHLIRRHKLDKKKKKTQTKTLKTSIWLWRWEKQAEREWDLRLNWFKAQQVCVCLTVKAFSGNSWNDKVFDDARGASTEFSSSSPDFISDIFSALTLPFVVFIFGKCWIWEVWCGSHFAPECSPSQKFTFDFSPDTLRRDCR